MTTTPNIEDPNPTTTNRWPDLDLDVDPGDVPSTTDEQVTA